MMAWVALIFIDSTPIKLFRVVRYHAALWAHGRVLSPHFGISRFACTQRAAFLRFGTQTAGPCPPWFVSLTPVHPRWARRLRRLNLPPAFLYCNNSSTGYLQDGEGAHHGLEGVQPVGGVGQLQGEGGCLLYTSRAGPWRMVCSPSACRSSTAGWPMCPSPWRTTAWSSL